MKKVVIFGAGSYGKTLYERLKDKQEILFFTDNNANAENVPPHAHVRVLPPSILKEVDFDLVHIASVSGLESIYKQLTEDLEIPARKVNRMYSEYWQSSDSPTPSFLKYSEEARNNFLKSFSFYAYENNIEGSAAEIGVHRGSFAKEINRVFPTKKLYLFDTFEGFPENDLDVEKSKNPDSQGLFNWVEKNNFLKDCTVEDVINIMPFPENCMIKKGYFPETFDIRHEKFAFVNIDTDLYQPTKAGLEIFYPLMSSGGVILIHDYFCGCLGVTKAVDEFLEKEGLTAIPIGDLMSIAIVKN
ncbi:MAG: TylF/MycF family methyltransferase [Oscillospiraceae bacterium]|nr:TylF/MycF family methyltransferase [Oscillospiraceae bacterium]